MASFIVRRLIQTVFVIFLVTIITFSLMQIIPGDPVVTMLGTEATPQQIENLRHELWLDRPIYRSIYTLAEQCPPRRFRRLFSFSRGGYRISWPNVFR